VKRIAYPFDLCLLPVMSTLLAAVVRSFLAQVRFRTPLGEGTDTSSSPQETIAHFQDSFKNERTRLPGSWRARNLANRFETPTQFARNVRGRQAIATELYSGLGSNPWPCRRTTFGKAAREPAGRKVSNVRASGENFPHFEAHGVKKLTAARERTWQKLKTIWRDRGSGARLGCSRDLQEDLRGPAHGFPSSQSRIKNPRRPCGFT